MTRFRNAFLLGLAAAAIASLAVIVPAALAQDGTQPTPPPGGAEVTQDQVNAVAGQLFCPVCQNVPLDVCGTQACADWRSEIRTMLADGKSPQQIKDYFASRYGQRVLATPEARGLNLLVWVLPVVGALAALAVAVLALRRMAPGALAATVEPGAAAGLEDLDPDYVTRMARDLEEFGE